MSVRIGISPITWCNDDMPELGRETPLETMLSEIKQAGYDGSEMGGKFPSDPAKLRPILEQHGLVLVSGWYSGQLLDHTVEQEIEDTASHLNLMAEMGCKVMVYAETTGTVQNKRDVPLSQRPHLADDRWADYGERLTRVAEHFQKRGVQMAFHHHMGTVVETQEEVDRLMEHTGDAVGLLADSGHITFVGGDPLAQVCRYGSRICHVHCKDVRPAVMADAKNRDRSFLDSVLDGVFTVPGDGSIDYRPILSALKDFGYEGWLVVEAEQDPAVAHPLTYATKGYQHLRQLVDEIGL